MNMFLYPSTCFTVGENNSRLLSRVSALIIDLTSKYIMNSSSITLRPSIYHSFIIKHLLSEQIYTFYQPNANFFLYSLHVIPLPRRIDLDRRGSQS